jgi:exopolyphosphatase / guanosine-5'-triphosphate,3'-diphosphate pyrophosphatase
MRLATIDIGTNTALLLISEWGDDGLQEVFNASGFARLGEGMDSSGRVGEAALNRLEGVLHSHMEHIRIHKASHIIVTGTSASRDAKDADKIHSLVWKSTKSDLTILSGDEEALVTFLGAAAGLGSLVDGPELTVIDVGGGSTEFVQGAARADGEKISFKCSLNMGSVRMTERYFSQQPAPHSEIQTAKIQFRELMSSHLENAKKTKICVGASGTARILALVHHGINELSSTNGPASITRSQLEGWVHRLTQMTFEEVTALHPIKMSGRADVLPAGALILGELLRFTDAETLIISPFGVRHGVAIRYFRESCA